MVTQTDACLAATRIDFCPVAATANGTRGCETPEEVKLWHVIDNCGDGNQWSIEPAGQNADSSIVARGEIGLENTLKEESLFVVIPIGEVGGN